MKRIIKLLEKLPNAPVGSEFEVSTSNIILIKSNRGGYSPYHLSELQGWYEEVKEMPKEGAVFWWVDGDGLINSQIFKENEVYYQRILNFQGYMETMEEAEAFRDRIEGVVEK